MYINFDKRLGSIRMQDEGRYPWVKVKSIQGAEKESPGNEGQK